MASIQNIAENIAYSYNEQFNHTFIQSIKDAIIDYRAQFIRQDLTKNSLSYSNYLESYCLDLILVDKSECPSIKTEEYVLRTKEKVEKPIRLKTNGRSNFKFVGSITRSKSYTFTSVGEINYLSHLPYQDLVIYYTYLNGYIYVYNTIKPCKILVEYVPENPLLINNCDDDILPDHKEFKIPADMLTSIKKSIKRDYGRKLTDGEEVHINKDIDDTE